MRIYEFYDLNRDHSKPAVPDNRKPQITLRHLNRLKHIRRRNKIEHDQKLALLPVMYSGERLQQLEELESDISDQIDAAKIEQKEKDHIRDMALNAIKKGEELS